MTIKRKTVSLSDPMLGDLEANVLADVIESGWLTMGQRVARFETAFAELHDRKEAVAVSSCTAALHLGLAALGMGPGDEVLVPSLTFVATANAVLYTGATPIFVDIEALTVPHMSLEDAATKITPNTRAVIIMHYGGYLADMQVWRDFADQHGLWLIEDAAHAPESAGRDGLADVSAYSFFSNKNMTTAEGGMLLARDLKILKTIRLLRTHGMTSSTLDRYQGHAFSYDVTALGYNYRMDELRAALGLVQLQKLPSMNKRRRRLTLLYHHLISEACLNVALPFQKNWETDAHLLTVILPKGVDRQRIMQTLREQGIQSSIHYPPIHMFSCYRDRFLGKPLPNTEDFFQRELSLPLHPTLSENDIEFVVGRLQKGMNQI